jgi:hypothetical protein
VVSIFLSLTRRQSERGKDRSGTVHLDVWVLVRTRSRARSEEEEEEEFDLASIGVDRMLQYLEAVGALPTTDPSGSGVLPPQPVDPGSHVSLASLEALLQRLLAQPSPGAQPVPPATAPTGQTSTPAATGKPSLKFPDPPLYEGDPA